MKKISANALMGVIAGIAAADPTGYSLSMLPGMNGVGVRKRQAQKPRELSVTEMERVNAAEAKRARRAALLRQREKQSETLT